MLFAINVTRLKDDKDFIPGSICPNCGSYYVKTDDGQYYKCIECDYEFKPIFSNRIYCSECKKRYAEYDKNRYNIISDDGILFHCNNCGTDFIKTQKEKIYKKKCNDGKIQVLIPSFPLNIKQNTSQDKKSR